MQKGFTLLELSIVLVIIGLIAGGVIAGQEIIRAAELRSVIRDVEELKIAALTFNNKYGHYPGDFNKASDFWSSCTDLGANTCNGNGDGIITTTSGLAGMREALRALQHTSLAGLVPGSYSGANTHDHGVNVMPSKIGDSGYYYTSSHAVGAAIYGRRGNYIRLASDRLNYDLFYGGVLSGEEAWSVDKKMDDGLADKGEMVSFSGVDVSATSCTTAAWNQPSASYVLAPVTEKSCSIAFFLD